MLPCPIDRLGLMPGGRVVITDDGAGVAAELASPASGGGNLRSSHRRSRSTGRLELALGHRVGRRSIAFARPDRGHHSRACRWAGHGRRCGLEPDWSARIGAEVRGLFLLAKAAAGDLERAARAGGSCLIAATAMGGRFASGGTASCRILPRSWRSRRRWSRRWRANGPRSVAASSTFAPTTPSETIAAPVGRRDLRQRRLPRGRLRGRSPDSPAFRREPALAREPGARAQARRAVSDLRRGPRNHRASSPPSWHAPGSPTLLMVGTTPLPERRVGRHRRHDRRSRDQGGLARPAAARGPARQVPPRSNRPISPCAGLAKSAKTSRSFARPAPPSRTPRPTCATPSLSPACSTSGAPVTASPPA